MLQSLQIQGEDIARQLGNGVIYRAPWMPYGPSGEFFGHMFLDDPHITGTTFVCKSLEDCKAGLNAVRERFQAQPPEWIFEEKTNAKD